MAEYAKRTCYGCGIRLPQPQMQRLEIERTGVRGNSLPTRPEWICERCFPRFRMRSPLYRYMAQREAERAERAEREKASYEAGKLAWAEEQERRRIANLERKRQQQLSCRARPSLPRSVRR